MEQEGKKDEKPKKDEEKDIFCDVMEEFLDTAINKSESLEKMYESAQKQYQKTTAYKSLSHRSVHGMT